MALEFLSEQEYGTGFNSSQLFKVNRSMMPVFKLKKFKVILRSKEVTWYLKSKSIFHQL